MSAHLLLSRLLDYIEEQAKEVAPKSFRLAANDGFMRHPAELQGLPGVEFDIATEGDHIWLRVQRLETTEPPMLPMVCQGLVRVSHDPSKAGPTIDDAAVRSRIVELTKGKTPAEVNQTGQRVRAAVADGLVAYTMVWQAWAAGEKPRRDTIDLYGNLFAVKQALEAEETARPLELVWGMGRATWRLSHAALGSMDFDYPLLTQEMEMSVDGATMALSLRPRATDTRYEGDVFAAYELVGAADVERTIREELVRGRERPVSPFDPASYSHLVRAVASNLDSKGSFLQLLEDSAAVPTAGDSLVTTDAWVLFVRPRANNYLIEDLHRLKKRLEDKCDIPAGPAALVTPPSDEPVAFSAVSFRGLSSRGTKNGGQMQELFFPLPYNEEQVTIVRQLTTAEGVTVQGPPGTGKTHTIANIICHYLALGKKILVTSKGEPALEVLQEKIPEEVRALTVSLLAGDREGMSQFQAAIATIQARVSQLNQDLTKAEIERLSADISPV